MASTSPAPDDDSTPVAKSARSGAEIGSTGLQQYGGHVREEFLPALAGDRLRGVVREMADNDPVIGGILHSIDMLLRQVEWRVEPTDAGSVEEIVARRQEERAKAIAASQAAEEMRQQQAEAMAQGALPGQASAPAKKKAAEKVAKELAQFGTSNLQYRHHYTVLKRLGIDPEPFIAHLKDTEDQRLTKAADVKAAGDKKALIDAKRLDEEKAKLKSRPDPTDPTTDPDAASTVEGEELAVFVETCLDDMQSPWEDTLSQIATMLPYGWHTAELVYKRRAGWNKDPRKSSRFNDGKIGWMKWAPRSQDTRFRWEIDKATGDILGQWQLDTATGKGLVFIPNEKMLLFRTRNHKNNPEGRSILRNAYRPWYFKKRIEEIEAIGVERDLAGLPIAWVPPSMMSPDATAEETEALNEIKSIVRNIKRDEQEGVVWPLAYDPESGNKLYDITLLSTGGSRQFDTDAIVSRYDQRIAMTVLADFILLGHEQVGSKSLGVSKIDLFTAALEAWLDGISSVVNYGAVPRLMRLNGMDPAMSPKLTHGSLSQIDLTSLGGFITALSGAGAPLFPDDALEGYMRDVAGLPKRDGSDDL